MIGKLLRLALHWQIGIALLLGALIGVTCNLSLGHRRVELKPDVLPAGFQSATIDDRPGRAEIVLVEQDGQRKRWVVGGDAQDRQAGSLASFEELEQRAPHAYRLFRAHGRSWARRLGDWGDRLGQLFIRMLRMVSIPLIVASLGSGVMGLGKASSLGRIFTRTFAYYLATSMLAIVTGLLAVNLIRPGIGTSLRLARLEEEPHAESMSEILFQQLEALIPPNPIAALSDARFLSIISFTILFSVCAIVAGGRILERLRQLFSDAFDVMMTMTNGIIRLAPVGVFFLILYVTATQGSSVFVSLAMYMVTVLAALAFHALVILPLLLRFVARRSPLEYAKAMSPALLTAFSSASSNGTLPVTISCVEQRAGVSNRISSFVLPLGATINMDGTALYEAVAVLFIAQVYHGSSLPIAQQIIVAMTALMVSIGAAGIPHAGLVMMVVILQAVGLPAGLLGLLLSVDRVLDMCRTSVNVWSDSCGCAVVSQLERMADVPTEPIQIPSEPD